MQARSQRAAFRGSHTLKGVALLPFIDEEALLAATEPLLDQLTEEEKYRCAWKAGRGVCSWHIKLLNTPDQHFLLSLWPSMHPGISLQAAMARWWEVSALLRVLCPPALRRQDPTPCNTQHATPQELDAHRPAVCAQ